MPEFLSPSIALMLDPGAHVLSRLFVREMR